MTDLKTTWECLKSKPDVFAVLVVSPDTNSGIALSNDAQSGMASLEATLVEDIILSSNGFPPRKVRILANIGQGSVVSPLHFDVAGQ